MDEFGLRVSGALSVLADVVNCATVGDTVAEVPAGLISDAQHVLAQWQDGEFGTDAIRRAARRLLK